MNSYCFVTMALAALAAIAVAAMTAMAESARTVGGAFAIINISAGAI
jgi:hypothetical protein